jgi:hypothetical protein
MESEYNPLKISSKVNAKALRSGSLTHELQVDGRPNQQIDVRRRARRRKQYFIN